MKTLTDLELLAWDPNLWEDAFRTYEDVIEKHAATTVQNSWLRINEGQCQEELWRLDTEKLVYEANLLPNDEFDETKWNVRWGPGWEADVYRKKQEDGTYVLHGWLLATPDEDHFPCSSWLVEEWTEPVGRNFLEALAYHEVALGHMVRLFSLTPEDLPTRRWTFPQDRNLDCEPLHNFKRYWGQPHLKATFVFRAGWPLRELGVWYPSFPLFDYYAPDITISEKDWRAGLSDDRLPSTTCVVIEKGVPPRGLWVPFRKKVVTIVSGG